jgi:hypothetical protein
LKDIEPFVNYPSRFALIGQPESYKKKKKDSKEVVKYNSSVMAFNAGAGSRLYHLFTVKAMNEFRSDQDWIGRVFPDLDTFPGNWVTKLRYCPNGKPPEETKIMLCMPGKNDRAAQRYEWIRKIWI